MMQDAYVKLARAETETILAALNPLFEGGAFEAETSVIMAKPLSFYPGYRLLDITEHKNMTPARRFVILKNGKKPIAEESTIIDFTNLPIYQLNSQVPISITQENIIDYLRFFFSYVRGRHGRFLVVESVDDIPWREEPPPAARKAVAKMIHEVQLNGVGSDGAYQISAQMMFKDSLFKADIAILPSGQVTIGNEQLLVEDMPVLDDTLGQ